MRYETRRRTVGGLLLAFGLLSIGYAVWVTSLAGTPLTTGILPSVFGAVLLAGGASLS